MLIPVTCFFSSKKTDNKSEELMESNKEPVNHKEKKKISRLFILIFIIVTVCTAIVISSIVFLTEKFDNGPVFLIFYFAMLWSFSFLPFIHNTQSLKELWRETSLQSYYLFTIVSAIIIPALIATFLSLIKFPFNINHMYIASCAILLVTTIIWFFIHLYCYKHVSKVMRVSRTVSTFITLVGLSATNLSPILLRAFFLIIGFLTTVAMLNIDNGIVEEKEFLFVTKEGKTIHVNATIIKEDK